MCFFTFDGVNERWIHNEKSIKPTTDDCISPSIQIALWFEKNTPNDRYYLKGKDFDKHDLAKSLEKFPLEEELKYWKYIN